MKIGVMGAGAVGCYYGALLARAGHEVMLIGRPALVDEVRRHGLRLQSDHFDGPVPVQASTDPAALAGCALVLFCVKSGDTLGAGAAMAPALGSDTVMLSLQNGVDNAERLAALLQRPVIPTVVYVATAMAGAGHVQHFGRGELVLGESPASGPIAAVLSQAGIPATVSDQVLPALWAKLVINCCYNALSAITQLPYRELVAGEGVLEVMGEVYRECLAVAAASGIALPETLWSSTLEIARAMPGQRSSTAQDLARHKSTEIDHLNGAIVARGEALGIATPVNRTLHSLVRLLEQRPAREG